MRHSLALLLAAADVAELDVAHVAAADVAELGDAAPLARAPVRVQERRPPCVVFPGGLLPTGRRLRRLGAVGL